MAKRRVRQPKRIGPWVLPHYTVKLIEDEDGEQFIVNGYREKCGHQTSPWFYPLCKN